jgi:hypothetical protein
MIRQVKLKKMIVKKITCFEISLKSWRSIHQCRVFVLLEVDMETVRERIVLPLYGCGMSGKVDVSVGLMQKSGCGCCAVNKIQNI